jgi:soluble lytic murein transglycosylase-like protein
MKHFLLRFFISFAFLISASLLSWTVVAEPVAEKTSMKTAKSRKGSVSCIRMNKKSLNRRAKPYQASIAKYAKKYNVDADLVKAVIAAESCYNRNAVSPKNAQGLMQLIPATASRFGVSNSFNADQNIRGGTRYLSFLLKRYKGNLYKAVAGYNAGEGAVDKYKGIPPYRETQHYVRNVLQVYGKLSGKMIPVNMLASNVRLNKNGRVSGQYKSPFAGGKPGRNGLMANKLKAPHLYKR